MKKIYVTPGQLVIKYMPYSEVMMHMRIAGKVMPLELTKHNMVQLIDPVYNETFSSPVTPGEAGLYWDDKANQYYFTQED